MGIIAFVSIYVTTIVSTTFIVVMVVVIVLIIAMCFERSSISRESTSCISFFTINRKNATTNKCVMVIETGTTIGVVVLVVVFLVLISITTQLLTCYTMNVARLWYLDGENQIRLTIFLNLLVAKRGKWKLIGME